MIIYSYRQPHYSPSDKESSTHSHSILFSFVLITGAITRRRRRRRVKALMIIVRILFNFQRIRHVPASVDGFEISRQKYRTTRVCSKITSEKKNTGQNDKTKFCYFMTTLKKK